MSDKETNHLPVFGVGPFYGAGVIISAIAGIVLAVTTDLLNSGVLPIAWLNILMVILGIAISLIGALIWYRAALGCDSIGKHIVCNSLCTTGVFSIVRNPCYSGIALFCTGVLVSAHNMWLLILPPVYWISMTIMLKCSEEKWLKSQYGDDYVRYCARVNRCIPWFPKKTSDPAPK